MSEASATALTRRPLARLAASVASPLRAFRTPAVRRPPPQRRGGRRRRTPTILQMEATECGAASLAMILGYYGRWVSLEELRLGCGVSRDGTKAINLLKAARSFGLTARGFKKEPAQLEQLPVPSILYWNFNHFLVFEGRRRGHVYLNDPAFGPRAISEGELDEGFTGVVLAFEPGPSFARGGARPNAAGFLSRQLANSRAALGFVLAASLALVMPGILIPAFTKAFVDNVLVERLDDWVVPLLLGMGVTALLRGAVTWLQQRGLLSLQAKLAIVMASRQMHHLLRLPSEFFTQRMPGDIANRVQANDRVAKLLSSELASTLIGLATTAFYAAVMAAYDLALTGIGIGFGLLNLLALRAVRRRREDNSRRLLSEQGKLVGTTIGAIRALETLKSAGLEQDAFARWSGIQAKMLDARQRSGVADAVLDLFPSAMSMLTTTAILAIGSLRVMDGALTLGGLVAFQGLMSGFTEPIGKLVGFGGLLQAIKGDLVRIEDVLRYRLDHRFAKAGAPAAAQRARLAGAIELRNISFGYSPLDLPLIDGFSLTLEPGMRVALVGSSGSGKSTIGRIIAGWYHPWSGEVLLDGMPLAAIPPVVFANSVAYVDQDIFLFNGTIRENLTLWDDTVPQALLTEALKDAAIHDEIAARPGAYDGPVFEGGSNFSSGQRQRLELARALVRDPALLVLDEATAGLDAITEKLIDDSIRRRGCTCLIIAHRLSTVRDCDEIIVLERGRVVERGTHDALLARDGAYARLIRE